MTARDYLYGYLMDALTAHRTYEESHVKANQLIDAFAHELAEQIRKEGREWDGWPDHENSMNIAANLIDPEVNDERLA